MSMALTVKQLKAELSSIGLPTHGLKAELKERLEAALEAEEEDASTDSSPRTAAVPQLQSASTARSFAPSQPRGKPSRLPPPTRRSPSLWRASIKPMLTSTIVVYVLFIASFRWRPSARLWDTAVNATRQERGENEPVVRQWCVSFDRVRACTGACTHVWCSHARLATSSNHSNTPTPSPLPPHTETPAPPAQFMPPSSPPSSSTSSPRSFCGSPRPPGPFCSPSSDAATRELQHRPPSPRKRRPSSAWRFRQ